jgi:alginate O-acetyltransferase complex protein AlgI
LRDYLYIPLGGNRKGPRRTYFNLAVVMLLGGLWHGANWTFVAWGGLHGGLLAFERWRGKQSLYGGLPRAVRVAITFVLVLITWVFFRAQSLEEALRYLAAMFGLASPQPGSALLGPLVYTRGYWLVMALAATLAFSPLQGFDWVKRLTWLKVIVLAVLLLWSLATMFTQAYSPFLYFQF